LITIDNAKNSVNDDHLRRKKICSNILQFTTSINDINIYIFKKLVKKKGLEIVFSILSWTGHEPEPRFSPLFEDARRVGRGRVDA
jgi:hypothetical protein